MPMDKKQQIRGIRILLTVFYGFLLSSILFRYFLHGIVETIRQPTNPFAIALIVIGTVVLVSIGLSIYATWFDNTMIMLVSGIVLIIVFILTLVFGIINILKSKPPHGAPKESTQKLDSTDTDPSSRHDISQHYDSFGVAENVAGLIIELISILFAILGIFVLYRYVKSKYTSVPTREPAAAAS